MYLPSFLFTLLSFAIALGVLVFVHEFGHFAVAKWAGVKVQRFSIGFGPVIFGWRRGETEYAISALPLGGYVKMLGEGEDDPEAAAEPERAFLNHPYRAAIVAAGPLMNIVFAFVAYAALFVAVGVQEPSTLPVMGGVIAGLPAAAAGLQARDRIVSIEGQPIETWMQLSEAVRASGGKRLRLEVERGGERLTVEVTPVLQENRTLFNEPAGESYRIGIEASTDWRAVAPLEAIEMAATQTATAVQVVALGLLKMVQGRVALQELGGPIAIAQAAGQHAREGAANFLYMLAFLSVNLAVLNVLPIPALDGGHLAFFAIEGLLRRPLRKRHREIAQNVGFVVLVALMVFVIYNDIHRLLG